MLEDLLEPASGSSPSPSPSVSTREDPDLDFFLALNGPDFRDDHRRSNGSSASSDAQSEIDSLRSRMALMSSQMDRLMKMKSSGTWHDPGTLDTPAMKRLKGSIRKASVGDALFWVSWGDNAYGFGRVTVTDVADKIAEVKMTGTEASDEDLNWVEYPWLFRDEDKAVKAMGLLNNLVETQASR